MGELGWVRAVWRHPVKSMQGESVPCGTITDAGLVGDRRWAVRDLTTDTILSAKRHPALLLVTARACGEGALVTVPGSAPVSGAAADAAVSEFLGRPVRIDAADPAERGFVDEADLHLLTGADTRWDVRRFRANLVLSAEIYLEELVGARLTIGAVSVDVTGRTKRCGMTTAAQPGLAKDVGVLRTLAHDSALCHGVYARVVSAGAVAVGDPVRMS